MKRPQVGSLWRGPLGHHEILRVTGQKVVVCGGDRHSKKAQPYGRHHHARHYTPPTETEFDLALYMTNQKPNERDAGNSGTRWRARARAGQKTKPLRQARKR